MGGKRINHLTPIFFRYHWQEKVKGLLKLDWNFAQTYTFKNESSRA
jgi:hypothetical protein